MNCFIKHTPQSEKTFYGNGNRGVAFPVQSFCGDIDQPLIIIPPDEFCYLALEIDPVDSPILMEEIGPGPIISEPGAQYMLAAPCIVEYEDECYLALQENGYTPIEIQETQQKFYAPCTNV